MAFTATYHEDSSDQDQDDFADSDMMPDDYDALNDDAMNSPGRTPTALAHIHNQSHSSHSNPHNHSQSHSTSHSQSQSHSHSAHASPVGLLTDWTALQCAEWVSALGLGQYANLFIRESVNGEALIEMQNEDLKDIGINSMGHRLTVLKAVYEIKLKQHIPLDPDHYIPLSAEGNAYDMTATQDDIARVIESIRQRDQRILAAEADLRVMKENFERMLEENRKLREDTLPVIRMAKDRSQPLPTPEPGPDEVLPEKKPSGLSRKFSTKKLFLGSAPKNPSPTIHEASSLEPSAAATAASSHLMSTSQNSPTYFGSQLSPTSPQHNQQASSAGTRSLARDGGPSPGSRQQTHDDHYPSYKGVAQSATSAPQGSSRGTRRKQPHSSQPWEGQLFATLPPTASDAPSRQREERERDHPDRERGESKTMDIIKSFRVSMDEPCYQVLPVAVDRYKLPGDWSEYAMYIVYGDRERCIGLLEKPLLLFKQLDREGQNPMFMLRQHASPPGLEGWTRSFRGEVVGPGMNMRGDDLNRVPGGVL